MADGVDDSQRPQGKLLTRLVIILCGCLVIGWKQLKALHEILPVLRPGGLFVYETIGGQLLAHPLRANFHLLAWSSVPEFRLVGGALPYGEFEANRCKRLAEAGACFSEF